MRAAAALGLIVFGSTLYLIGVAEDLRKNRWLMRNVFFVLYMCGVLLLAGFLHAQEVDKENPNARCMRPDVIEKYGPTSLTLHPCQCHATCVRPDVENGQTFEPYTLEGQGCALHCKRSQCLCEPDVNACDLQPDETPK